MVYRCWVDGLRAVSRSAQLKNENTMKRFLWLSSLCLVFLIFIPSRSFAQCTGERWSVKTGTDPDATLVNLNSTTSTTIASLSGIAAPATLPDNARIQPTEITTWVLNATLVKYARSFDADYHMVFTDSAGHTMIAEIPDPGCGGPVSPFAAGIAHARAQFDAMFTATSTFQNANVPVQITGAEQDRRRSFQAYPGISILRFCFPRRACRRERQPVSAQLQ